MKINYIILISIIFCSACASKYYPVYKNAEPAKNDVVTEGISLSYCQVKLNDEGGYAKEARKNDLQFIHVRLVNNRDSTIILNRNNFDVYVDYSPVTLLVKNKVRKKLKQRPGYHFLWLLTVPGSVGYYNGKATVSSLGVGIGAAGATFGIYNYIRGRKANKTFYEDFMAGCLLSQTVPKGSIAEGWLCIEHKGALKNLMIKFDDQ